MPSHHTEQSVVKGDAKRSEITCHVWHAPRLSSSEKQACRGLTDPKQHVFMGLMFLFFLSVWDLPSVCL